MAVLIMVNQDITSCNLRDRDNSVLGKPAASICWVGDGCTRLLQNVGTYLISNYTESYLSDHTVRKLQEWKQIKDIY